MGDCKCGCGEPDSNGDFIAGHSQKLTSSLVKEVGGIFALQGLIHSAKQYSYGEIDRKESVITPMPGAGTTKDENGQSVVTESCKNGHNVQ